MFKKKISHAVVLNRFWAMPYFGIFKILMLPVIFNSYIFINLVSKQAPPKYYHAPHGNYCSNVKILLSYLPNPSAQAGYDTRSLFKWSFPSPRLVALPRMKNPVCPTIYS